MPPKDASIGILRFANTSEITKRTRGKVEISLELVKKKQFWGFGFKPTAT